MKICESTDNKTKIRRYMDKCLGVKNRNRIIGFFGGIRHPFYRITMKRAINSEVEKCKYGTAIDYNDAKKWGELYYKLVKESYQQRFSDVPKFFFQADIKIVDKKNLRKNIRNAVDEPIVLCALKDEIKRLPTILKYYREILKVKYFVIIDNCSTDGSYEYLLDQEDVLLYRAYDRYNSMQRSAWFCRVIQDLGLDRWYLLIDADECFAYPKYENLTLKQYVNVLAEKEIFSVKALCIEMYPKGDLFKQEFNGNFLQEYKWFDPDSDEYCFNPDSGTITGGLHGRVFGTPWTTRTVIRLICPRGERFPISSHEIFPHYEGVKSPIGMILLHYKFLPGDMEKILKIIQEGNYANGSQLYKRYYQCFVEEKMTNFWNEKSAEWKGTESFVHFPYINDLTV